MSDKLEAAAAEKCYNKVKLSGRVCRVRSCRHYLNSKDNLNCSILAAHSGPKTLKTIGECYGVTRMRICQIEKQILKKLRKASENLDEHKPG